MGGLAENLGSFLIPHTMIRVLGAQAEEKVMVETRQLYAKEFQE